jgi:hypothetical protein
MPLNGGSHKALRARCDLPPSRTAPRLGKQLEPLEAVGQRDRMDDEKPGHWKHSYYHRLVRTQLGEALKDQLPPKDHLPDRLAELLRELDEADRSRSGSPE